MENQETKQIKEIGKFKSSYLLRVINGSKINSDADNIDNILKTSDFNPFRGIHLRLTDQFIEYKRRTWYILGVDKTQFNWQNVTGINVDKHLFGCHIKIMSSGGGGIIVHGFSKSKANQIYALSSKYISIHTQKSTTDVLSESFVNAISKSKGGQISIADELKKMKELLDNGIITKQEFDEQKAKLLQ